MKKVLIAVCSILLIDKVLGFENIINLLALWGYKRINNYIENGTLFIEED